MPSVLIADDEQELLELLRFSISSAGFDVTTAKDGAKALNLARTQKFDLIILDVMMPRMDGYHVASEITQDPTAPPILLLTSRDFSQDEPAIKGSGATAFLNKPFEIPELLNVANQLVQNHTA